jgi:hypothetical protein
MVCYFGPRRGLSHGSWHSRAGCAVGPRRAWERPERAEPDRRRDDAYRRSGDSIVFPVSVKDIAAPHGQLGTHLPTRVI